MPGYITAQIVGAVVGIALVMFLYPDASASADDVVVPHETPRAVESAP